MVVTRRAFILGLGATLAATQLPFEKFTGQVATAQLRPFTHFRRICDVMLSSMPMGDEIRSLSEDPVRYTLFRDDNAVLSIMMNMRANFRWVGIPGEEIVALEKSIIRLEVEPCHTMTTLCIMSNLEQDRYKPERMIAETYHWRDNKLEFSDVAQLDVRDTQTAALLEKRK